MEAVFFGEWRMENHSGTGKENNRIELLAPAGGMDSLYAALAAGADAVYAGADRFGARAYAENFTSKDPEGGESNSFLQGLNYAHLFGRKVYLTLNILMKEREMEEIPSILDPLYQAGLDGVIVQDAGLIRFLRERYPLLPVHASTQMALTGVYGARFLKRLGAERAVLARELSLGEIREIREKAGIETECFIHGAMCYCYSGLCLMSSMLGGRSGNRGRCAGPCRQPYGDRNPCILSMKDLCALQYLPSLIDAEVTSLKIEGRMKPPAYVGNVTRIYRKYIDACYEGDISLTKEGLLKVPEEELRLLTELYTRSGRNPGYFERHNGREMITLSDGGYRSSLPEDFKIEMLSLPAEGHAVIREGEAIRLSVRSGSFTAEAAGAPAETAVSQGLPGERICRQLTKTGGSGFFFENLSIDTTGTAFVPVTALNALRREALDRLKREVLRGYQRSL